ncbi:Methionine import ATP-binding protein MetN [Durusdinium trenchii]
MTGTTPNAGSGTYASQAAMGAFGRPLSTPNSVRQRSPPGHEKDVVQFFSKTFYVSETEDSAVVRVIRIGSLQGTCDVAWYTEDFSAVAGRKYIGGEGILNFGPGESVRTFEVKIINDDNFDTALEFDVILTEPRNCVLDPRYKTSSVMILDDDLFPSNDFKEEIETGEEAALHEVGFSLLWSFIKFCFVHVDQIWWKTILVLLLANLGNAYYLATIFIKVYLIDTVLNTKDPEAEERLWIPGDRNGTAVCLGLAWVLPNIILLASDYFEMKGLEMGFNIRNHLRVNLFRKYLRYTSESRAAVPVQDLKIAIMEDIPDVVADGYLIIFELWAMLGKIGMVTIFMLKKTPGTALQTLAFYPILIALYLWCTYKRRLDLMGKEGEGQSATIGTLMHAHNNHKLINCYEKKTIVVRHFEEVLKTQRKHVMDLKSFSFWNSQLIPWITLLAIGFYIGGSAQMVLGGRISLGALVTTINIYKDLGDRFSTILDGLKSLSKAISPLGALTVQFNLEVDIPQKAAVFKTNEKFALSHGQKNFDLIPIAFKNISIDQSPTFRGGTDFTEEAPQGSVIQIVGPHDSGKGAILRRICDIDSEAPGMVLISPHLTVLQVPHEPLFLESGGVFSNLHMCTVGQKGFDKRTTARGRRILERLGLGKEWILNLYDQEESGSLEHVAEEKLAPTSPFSCFEEEEEEEEEEDTNPIWAQKLSGSEKWRFQLARAFVHDPHVLVVHRPVDELDVNLQQQILALFREFVDKKGLEIDEHEELLGQQRRPRTLIFSTGTSTKTTIPDYVWRLTDSGVKVEKHPAPHA